MESNPCSVCGATDVNLVDGFYYCVECGTQDVNVQETLVEHTVLADGTFAHTTSRRFTTVVKDGLEMSSEWYKWHIYNFILAGLTDEIISLGAKPSVKMKVLWIWIRYIKKFQVKEETEKSSNKVDNSLSKQTDNDTSKDDDSDKEEDELKKTKEKSEKFRRDITTVTKGTLFAIIYVALNLDRSDIQIWDLFRFINEERLSIFNCTKYVPKELDIKSISCWKNFTQCPIKYKPATIRMLAMTLFKRLELGVPIVPDLTKLLDNYLKELCLPSDFRDLVFSLVHLIPCDFLQIDLKIMKNLIRVPDYGVACMSYIVLAFKICFGLDCEYELKLSDHVDQINNEENHLKSYKLGYYSERTGRIFSFRDWYKFIHFRKTILCKNYLPFARLFKLPVDDSVLMEQLEVRNRRKIRLTDEVTMDVLNKIQEDIICNVIPTKEFPATLTPLTTYTEVILQYIQDPELKLQLSEDFTQYSLKYATKDFRFSKHDTTQDLAVEGVTETNKTRNCDIIGNMNISTKEGDTSLVFVRNCENKNWKETKPPTLDHITKKSHENISDNSRDHGYDSSNEDTKFQNIEGCDIQINAKVDEENYVDKEVIINMIEEDVGVSIFDDDFDNVENDKNNVDITTIESEHIFEFCNNLTKDENNSIVSNMSSDSYMDLEKVDRNILIQELIEIARQKYKIPKPRESHIKGRRKRKINLTNDEACQVQVKRKKKNTKTGETKNVINNIISSYYEHINNEVLNKLSEHVKSFIETLDNNEENNQINVSLSMQSNNINEAESCIETVKNTSISLEESNISHLHTITQNEMLEDTNSDEELVDNLIHKSDPAFDKQTHDISQLYVEFENNKKFENIEDWFDINDTQLDSIINKKIEEINESKKSSEESLSKNDSFSDSEDDLPLINLKEEKEFYRKRKKHAVQNLDHLLTRPKNIKQYNMWLRHYRSRSISRIEDSTAKFDFELNENYPSSFVFVIRECAAILNCTPFLLYKSMNILEQKLICFVD